MLIEVAEFCMSWSGFVLVMVGSLMVSVIHNQNFVFHVSDMLFIYRFWLEYTTNSNKQLLYHYRYKVALVKLCCKIIVNFLTVLIVIVLLEQLHSWSNILCFRNQEVHRRVTKSTPLNSVLTQLYLFHTFMTHSPSTLDLQLYVFLPKFGIHFLFPYVCYRYWPYNHFHLKCH